MEKNKEILENEVVENESDLIVSNNIMGFSELNQGKSDTVSEIITNIKDKKKLFNINTNVDYLLNDCEGECIRVKEVLIKRYFKPMKNPIIDEDTGEIVKDTELSMATVIIDENEKSYATGSKMFGIQLLQYINMFAINNDIEPFEIKIIKKEIKDSKNKALAFELI